MRINGRWTALAAALTLAACGPAGGSEDKAAAPAAPSPPAAAPPAAPTAAAPLPERVDAKVAGTDFHATATVACARSADQPMAQCQAGVVRNADGSAVVTVFWPGGGSRAIFFGPNQTVTGADASQADGAARAKLAVTRVGDLSKITLGGERYEIVDALPYGG